MAGLPWIELDTDMPEHPKSLRMAAMLKEPLAFAYVVYAGLLGTILTGLWEQLENRLLAWNRRAKAE